MASLACGVLNFRLVKTPLLSALRCQWGPRSPVCLFTVRAYSSLCSQPKSAVITARTSCKRHGVSTADMMAEPSAGAPQASSKLVCFERVCTHFCTTDVTVVRGRNVCLGLCLHTVFCASYEQCDSGLTMLLGCFINFGAPKNSSCLVSFFFFFAADALKG